jgi:hypothetical protein
MPAPRVALAVVVDDEKDMDRIAKRLNDELSALLPAIEMDTRMLTPSHPILTTVRNRHCELF